MSKRKRLSGFLAALLLMCGVLTPLSGRALAVDVELVATVAEAPVGESAYTFTVDIFVTEAEAYAGLEFGVQISDESAVTFVSFAPSVAGAMTSPFITTRNTHYFGFYATTNAYSDRLKVGTMTFTYTGSETQTIVFTHMKIVRVDGPDSTAGIVLTPPAQVITVKRVVPTQPGDDDDNDPGGSENPNNPSTPNNPSGNDGIIVDIGENETPLAGLQSKYFDDVGPDVFWAVDAVDDLYEKGVMKGTGERIFSPNWNLQRGDLILMLVRAYDLQAPMNGNFPDVPEGSYYYDAIAICKTLDIARGDGVNFHPNDPITRQDMMALIDRTLIAIGVGVPRGAEADLAAFSDQALIADYARESVASLVKAGIIQGTGDGINPYGSTSRAEIAVVFSRILAGGE